MQTEVPSANVHPTAYTVVTDDGIALAVSVWGSGPALIMVHGFGGAKEDFADHAPVLAQHYTVVAFDHRGHGSSDKPAELDAYSFARLRADTLAVADHLGIETFTILGHSMGGMIVRGIVVEHPQRIDALIMMDTTAGPIPGFDPEIMELGATIALTEGKAALKAAMDLAAPLDTPAYQAMLAQKPGYKEFCDRKWNDLSEIMWASLARAIASQVDELPEMAAITFPTLIIVGEQDTPFLSCSQAMLATIPGAELSVIPNAGHSPQFEGPQAWNAALDSFLERCRTAAASA